MASDKLMKLLAERRAAEQLKAQQAAQQTPLQKLAEQYKADIPDIDVSSNISPEQKALDDFIRLIGIVDAYNRWAGKGTASPQPGRVDSNKVRCPNPSHPDKNPSAWINTEKNVWHCAACSMGGDLWDIAAWHFGFPVPGYKHDPATFRLLREKIGQDFGMTIEKGIAGDTYLVSTAPAGTTPVPPTEVPAGTDSTAPVSTDSTVTYTTQGATHAEAQSASTDENAKRKYPNIPWRDLVPDNTFLREYLEATTVDDSPEEFHFWNGLVALGMGVGGYRTLEDSPEVSGNLFVCLVGDTGTGKSKSNRHLVNVLLEALPYKSDDQPPYGANYLKGGQSGEYIIKNFQHPIIDPSGKPIGFWPGVKGLIHFDELADLVGKSGRMGSTLKTTLMELYDNPRHLRSGSLAHGTIDAERPFGSVVTTTQFTSVRELITRQDEGSGFANRWVFATGVKKKQFAINRMRVDLSSSVSKLAALSNGARVHELVTWSPGAEKIWDEFFHHTFIPMRGANTESNIIQRLDLLMKKLFLLFAANDRVTVVGEQHVQRALSIYPYLLETYGRIDSEIAATREGDDVDLVLRQIVRMTGSRGPTANEIYKVVKRRITSVANLRKILENMVILGLIEEQKVPPGPRGGRPTSCYTTAPGVQIVV